MMVRFTDCPFFLLYSCGGGNNYYLFSATQPPWVVARLPTSTPSTAVRVTNVDDESDLREDDEVMMPAPATTTSVNGHAVELTKSNLRDRTR